ncbi:MAG TPA: alpha/beta hydrolase [Thermoanaerobaculia bacterium]|nr:alpha/beta hydrolase [Thermoanaerobaculia bacterium]
MSRFRCPALLVVAWLVATPSLTAAGEPVHGYFTASDGVKIHYMQLGDHGSHVVLIHGYTGSAEGNWFRNGIAEALAKEHRVVAIDCRNHGRSDKPTPRGPGKAEDVIELMNHLDIEKAHIHGYSMGGGITARLLASHPDRFLTASFGGSGIRDTDEAWIARTPPDPEGTDPEEVEARRGLRIRAAMDNGMSREEAERAADAPPPPRPTPAPAGLVATAAAPLEIDLTKVTVPVLAINGELDRPYSRTFRMWRELRNFTSVVLPGKSHLTAIAAPFIPKEYEVSLVRFVNANDP